MKVGILRKVDGKSTYTELERIRESKGLVNSFHYFDNNGWTVTVAFNHRGGGTLTDIDGYWSSCHVIKHPIAKFVFKLFLGEKK